MIPSILLPEIKVMENELEKEKNAEFKKSLKVGSILISKNKPLIKAIVERIDEKKIFLFIDKNKDRFFFTKEEIETVLYKKWNLVE